MNSRELFLIRKKKKEVTELNNTLELSNSVEYINEKLRLLNCDIKLPNIIVGDIVVDYLNSQDMSSKYDELRWLFLKITRSNMKDLYDNNPWGSLWSNGWNDDFKMEELIHRKSNYLVASKSGLVSGKSVMDSDVQGFLCFRVELDDMVMKYIKEKPVYSKCKVAYMYELQCQVTNKGIGSELVLTLVKISKCLQLEKIMCTVLKANKSALNFYIKKMKFLIDEMSPDKDIRNSASYPYVILSLQL